MGFACKPGQAIGIAGEGIRQDLQRDVPIQLRVARAIHLPHAAFADLRADFVDAEAGAWGKGQSAVDYTGGIAVRTGLLLTDGVT